jgi:hypothetical protein
MSLTICIFILTSLPYVNPDICRPLATMIETQTFYLTQPYSKNISLDLSNFEEAFADLTEKAKLFNSNLNLFDEETELTDPENLTEFDENYNVFKIDKLIKGYASFEACSKRNGSIITLTNENRPLIVNALNKLNIDKTPFRALPFYSLFSLHDFSHLDNPDNDHILPLWTVSPPFISKRNTIEYPFGRKVTPPNYTTVKPGEQIPSHVDTTIHDYASQVLCLKENNPWDLPENKNKWLEIVPKVKKALNLVIRVKDAFVNSKHSLKLLPQQLKPKTLELFKLILPDPLKAILNFLDKFSRKLNWDKTNLKSKETFLHFTKEANDLARFFDLKSQNYLDTKTSFQHLRFDNHNWIQLLQLDEEKYGINGPITITPKSSLRDINPSSRDDLQLEVTAHLYVYDRNSNKYTLYLVKPNHYKGYYTTAKTLIQSDHFIAASTEDIKPSHCHSSPSELHPICNKLPFLSTPTNSFSNLAACGKALLNPKPSDDFWKCPYKPIPNEPFIYRANCDNNKHSTTIINSDKPILIDFFCDSEYEMTTNFTAFPSSIQTDCEARINNSADSHVLLPQSSKDFLYDPIISAISTPKPPPQSYIDSKLILILSITIPTITTLLLAISITIYCICKRKRTQLKRTLSQIQIRELQTFNQYPILAIESN